MQRTRSSDNIFYLFLMIIHHGNLRSTIEPPLLEKKKTGFMSPPSHSPLGRRQLMEVKQDGAVIQNKERTSVGPYVKLGQDTPTGKGQVTVGIG